MQKNIKRTVGILIFDKVEVLDFCGPFEVFSIASELNNFELFDVFTVAETEQTVSCINELSVNPKYSFYNSPNIDILIIPGGEGTKSLLINETVLNWVLAKHKSAKMTISICSGARILGKLGILNGIEYTTHHEVFDNLIEIAPKGIPIKNKRFTNNGKIYTSGGISAGIDLSFYIIEKLFNKEVVQQTARYMEYTINYNTIDN